MMRKTTDLSIYDLLQAYADVVQRRYAGKRPTTGPYEREIAHWRNVFHLAGVRGSLAKTALCLALRRRTDLLKKLDDVQIAQLVAIVGDVLREYKEESRNHFGIV